MESPGIPPSVSAASSSNPPADDPALVATPSVDAAGPDGDGAGEDYLDWRENLARPGRDVWRLDLLPVGVGLLVTALFVIGVIAWRNAAG